MELGEKLQALRKSRGLTQEELAEALYISRTAVSKWESGRGYPSIDSLREIARFFSVTIDELIRPDEILTVAEKDKRSFIDRYLSLICGLMDLFPAVLLFLPVFGGTGAGAAVPLNALTPGTPWIRAVFTVIIALTAACGLCGLTVSGLSKPVWSRRLLITGMALSVAGTGIFIAARQPYAAIVYFILLVIKGLILLRSR